MEIHSAPLLCVFLPGVFPQHPPAGQEGGGHQASVHRYGDETARGEGLSPMMLTATMVGASPTRLPAR